MKSFILANDGTTTNTYKYSKSVLKELDNLDCPCVVLGRLSGANYQRNKERIRQKAIDFQNSFADGKQYYYSELSEIQAYFETQAKRYGLIKEFKENCII